MRVAALYDVHGNLPALEAVLTDVERAQVDVVVVGGDVVWGAMPGEVLQRLRGLGDDVRFVLGNTDRDVARAAADGDDRAGWCAARLSDEERAFIGGWPRTVVVEVEGLGGVLFCHGSPRSEDEILTEASPEERVAPVMVGVEQVVVVCGHTHHQFDRRVAGRRLVNAGSVGLPYEGRPGAFWALLGPDVELHRTEYDVAAAAELLRGTGFPEIDDLLGSSLLEPVPREEAIAYFEERAAAGGA